MVLVLIGRDGGNAVTGRFDRVLYEGTVWMVLTVCHLSPNEGMITTIVLPLFSGRLPTVNAARRITRIGDVNYETE